MFSPSFFSIVMLCFGNPGLLDFYAEIVLWTKAGHLKVNLKGASTFGGSIRLGLSDSWLSVLTPSVIISNARTRRPFWYFQVVGFEFALRVTCRLSRLSWRRPLYRHRRVCPLPPWLAYPCLQFLDLHGSDGSCRRDTGHPASSTRRSGAGSASATAACPWRLT